LAAAIVVDASLIRLLIVPATMTILGPAAWWAPRWLDRLLRRDGTEAADRTAPQVVSHASVPALTLPSRMSRRSG
jgi:RND superfamily putative drug exporter